MTIVVLLVLAAIWGAVLLPYVRQARFESRPADSIGNFRRQLSVLRRTGPTVQAVRPVKLPTYAATMAPPQAQRRHLHSWSPESARRARTLKRRRDVFRTLLVAMGSTLVLGLIPAFRPVLAVHLLCDLLFAAYVVMLIQARNTAAERDMKLRFLPTAAQPDNVLLLRRSAN
ncbi:MAG TPA: hypothetical protein VFJ85_15540 [Acidimicrobiales bacterium]|nr:hypothetical protein [Acidimicrobiales bacterium]